MVNLQRHFLIKTRLSSIELQPKRVVVVVFLDDLDVFVVGGFCVGVVVGHRHLTFKFDKQISDILLVSLFLFCGCC